MHMSWKDEMNFKEAVNVKHTYSAFLLTKY